MRVERGPVGAWKSGRRTKLSSNVTRFKKRRGEERREESRRKERKDGEGHVALRQFFLMDGVTRFVDALREVTLPESFNSIRENNSFEQREM